ncbi:ABC transporter ATP-binding protein [Kribbella ginsengisoli]|uniref:ABC transporter ATP-binding protein n=1 Tax=Kribbella ginsengisoli TaxID=363865 RepID=A0ABP6W5V3_9ACTN
MREQVRTVGLWLMTGLRAAPFHSTALVVMLCLQAAIAPVRTYGVKLIVDGVGGAGEGPIRLGVVVILATFAVAFAGTSVDGYLESAGADRVERWVLSDILRLTTHIPGIEQHERPDVADRLSQLRDSARELGWFALVLFQLISTCVTIVLVVAMLSGVHPIFAVLLVLAFGQVWATSLDSKWMQDTMERMQPYGRLVRSLSELAREPRAATELRVFGLGPTLLSRIRSLSGTMYAGERRAMVRGLAVVTLAKTIFRLAYLGAVVYLIVLAGRGSASPGDLALVVLLAPQVDGAASEAGDGVSRVGVALRSFGRYRWLRDYASSHSWKGGATPAHDRLGDATPAPERVGGVGSAPVRLVSGIELRDLSFAYPGTDVAVLDSVSLVIPAGTSVALVGENGAGKSTLVKLLSRMYDPTSGSILVDGVPLSTIDPVAWRERLSAGYQDFVKYEFSARLVVGVGDLARLDDEEALRAALVRGEALELVEELPRGLDTQLGTRFSESSELSGGQWQRLALARAFLRELPLVLLLDEPTAALDPEAEHALYERFAEASRVAAAETGGITVLVSHRFSTVRMADLIVVMDQGRVVEVGSHQALVGARGRYAELFEVQARAYR